MSRQKRQNVWIDAADAGEHTHAWAAFGTGHTLCGLSGDEPDDEAGIMDCQPSTGKIDCPSCARIVAYCRAIKASDFERGLLQSTTQGTKEGE